MGHVINGDDDHQDDHLVLAGPPAVGSAPAGPPWRSSRPACRP
ncbi:MAG TPA: hypothetical protein PLH39_04855 [Promineifilum sp.]|nr:hypothetical protein [Promineifilum sp.]